MSKSKHAPKNSSSTDRQPLRRWPQPLRTGRWSILQLLAAVISLFHHNKLWWLPGFITSISCAVTFYLCPRRPWQRGSLPGDRSRPTVLRLHPGGHRQLQQRWMTNKGQVCTVSGRPKQRGDDVVHILINYKPWEGSCGWKLGPNQSNPSLSHPPSGCLGGFAWLGVTASLTCTAISLVLLKTGISTGYENDYLTGCVLRDHQTQFSSVTIKLAQIRADSLLN